MFQSSIHITVKAAWKGAIAILIFTPVPLEAVSRITTRNHFGSYYGFVCLKGVASTGGPDRMWLNKGHILRVKI